MFNTKEEPGQCIKCPCLLTEVTLLIAKLNGFQMKALNGKNIERLASAVKILADTVTQQRYRYVQDSFRYTTGQVRTIYHVKLKLSV